MTGTDLPGFADPVMDAQATFRAVLDAMAYPGRIAWLRLDLTAPAPLDKATAAVLLTLADTDTPVWLDAEAASARGWVQFHCGAPAADPAHAAFGVCLALPDLACFDWGSHDGPETGATVIVQVPALDAGPPFRLSGPGLRAPETVRLGLPNDFAQRWAANRAAFPRGVDLVVCSGDGIAALPRSISVERA